MAFSFRSLTTQGNGGTFPQGVTKPTGVVNGDLLIVVAELEDASHTWTSVGAGFNAVTPVNSSTNKLQIWWKIASGEPASWTWTASGGAIWQTIICLAYSGGTTPAVDVTGTGNSGTSQAEANQTAPSITTTVNNALLIFAYANDSSAAVTSTSGATTLRQSYGNVAVGDAIIASPGATGSIQAVGAGTQTFAAMQIAFTDGAGGGGGIVFQERRQPRGMERGIGRGIL